GSIPARLAAMQTNALQATLLQAPETLKAKEIGMRSLLDFTKLDVEWQQNGVATTRDYIKKKPDTIRRFMRAYVEGSHYNLTNPKGAQKILQKYLAIKDEKSIEEAYNEIVVKLTRRVPYPTEPGIQLFLDQLKTKNPKAGQVKPSEFTDISFLKELESSGYIDRMYKWCLAALDERYVRTDGEAERFLGRFCAPRLTGKVTRLEKNEVRRRYDRLFEN